MKLWEALKIHDETGRKIRHGTNGEFQNPCWITGDLARLFDSKSWEVEPAKVEVTREQLEEAWEKVFKLYPPSRAFSIDDLCKELGL